MNKKGMKIVTIGGGSSYTPELVEGFIKRFADMPVRELWLVDIEEGKEKLHIVGELAKRMVKKAGVPMEIHLTLDRRESLRDADYVTTQMRVGLLEARIKDERIPLMHGMIGQETNGAGGLFKGLRTIPVLLQIAEDMQELCPNAWLINFTNPAGMVTEALLRYGKHSKVIGICNVPITTKMTIAKMLDIDVGRLHIDFAGLNHLVYGLRATVDGEDVTEHVLQMLADPEKQLSMRNIAPMPWEPTFLQALGVIPCPYHRYYYKTQSDAACSLISSLYNGTNDIQTLNVRNNGTIQGIPNDSAVEVNCIVTKEGPKPITVGELPTAINGLVQQIKSFERVGAEAAVTGSYEKALLALTINPLVPSDEKAKAVLDDLLEAHREYLPQFFTEEQA
ncbi:6-phospho-beta-glucosidase [Brevibacterium sp. JNUCC-42]|nr:6-phospho-beta-glucosidase [Brevibacterium sp. JNUCC-42]